MRAFVAIELPLRVQTVLDGVGTQLRANLPGQRVRWVAPDHIHLTIKFLGEISNMQADALAGSLHALAAQLAPIQLGLGEAGCFSQRGMPSALLDGAERRQNAPQWPPALRRGGCAGAGAPAGNARVQGASDAGAL